MATEDDGGVTKAVSGAKAALTQARAKFPQPKAVPSATPRIASPTMTPVAKPSLGDELKSKSTNIDQYIQSVPKMHTGGPVKVSGIYHLKADEHVLTAKDAKSLKDAHGKAKTILSMTQGLKSLHRAGAMPPPAPSNTEGSLSTDKTENNSMSIETPKPVPPKGSVEPKPKSNPSGYPVETPGHREEKA
jgi:hypothetical protein